MSNKSPLVAIVIPFFQRKTGLLTACVDSIAAQQGVDDYLIIVVDDGSPVAAEDELAKSAAPAPKIKLVKQSNAGPGAARNRGLDSIPIGTRYVTFLDSDDEWRGNFLSDAVHALELGYDLFFGNSARLSVEKLRFDWDKNPALNIELNAHRLIDASRDLYEYQGDFFDLLVYRSNILGPTTMAYRYEKFHDVRFNTELFNGQDRLFKLHLGRTVERAAFSPRVYAEEGEGVNIFDRSQWGTERSIGFLSSYIELPKTILAEIPLSESQRQHVLGQLKTNRYSFVASIAHLIRNRASVDWRIVFRTFINDPLTALLLVPNAARVMFNTFKSERDSVSR